PTGAIDHDLVGRTVAARGSGSAGQIDIDPRHVGAAHVTDIDGVGAAAGRERDGFDAVHVHRNSGDIPGQLGPRAVGKDVDRLGDVGTIEQHRVASGLTFDDVVVIARIPHERVIAGAHQRDVAAVATGDEVVALAAEHDV